MSKELPYSVIMQNCTCIKKWILQMVKT